MSGAQLFAPVWMSGRRRSQFYRPFPPSRHQNVFSIRLSFDVPLGHVTAFFLFDVSNAIDLQRLRSEIEASVSTRLATKPATPTYLQYQQPPLTLDGAVIGAGEVNGCRVRFKAFDYGVISVALTHALPDTWDELVSVGPQWQDNPRLAEHAERLCRDLVTRISAAVSARHEPALERQAIAERREPGCLPGRPGERLEHLGKESARLIEPAVDAPVWAQGARPVQDQAGVDVRLECLKVTIAPGGLECAHGCFHPGIHVVQYHAPRNGE